MDSNPDLIERLRSVSHFRNLSLSDLGLIVSAGRIRKFSCGQTIFSEGEECSGMFVLIRGCVHLCKFSPQGRMNILSVIDPVIMFNEVAVLDGGTNPVTAIAAIDCLTWQVGYQSFHALIEKIPQVGLSLLRVLAVRNRQMIEHYEDLTLRGVLARTAKLLLELSNGGRNTIQRRKVSIEVMAQRAATVPEAISRSLNTIKSAGIIQVNRGEIAVLSIPELARLAQVDQEAV